jgi:hypothetical protein
MENNKKQTAVEWLLDALGYNENMGGGVKKVIDQAKAMEREQIIRARQDGLDNGFSNGSWDSNLYYNETYGDK